MQTCCSFLSLRFSPQPPAEGYFFFSLSGDVILTVSEAAFFFLTFLQIKKQVVPYWISRGPVRIHTCLLIIQEDGEEQKKFTRLHIHHPAAFALINITLIFSVQIIPVLSQPKAHPP